MPEEVYIVAQRRSDGLPSIAKAVGGQIFYLIEDAAKEAERTNSAVFRVWVTVEVEVR